MSLDISTSTPRVRRDMHLPEAVRRVHSAEFATQDEMARAYGVDKGTITYWKQRAFEMGLTNPQAWARCLTLGRLTRLAA